MTCGTRIKEEREKRGMTQEQLAEAMEVTRQAVSKWEADQSRPSGAKLEKLSALFELSMETWAPPPPPEAEALRRWKAVSAVLGALCLVLAAALAAALWSGDGRADPCRTGEPASPAEPEAVSDTAYMFPRSLPLAIQRVEDLGDQPLYVPEDGEAVERALASSDVLFSGQFPGPYSDGSRLEIRRANPRPENGTVFWEVWALRVPPDGEAQVLGRLSDYNHYVNQDGLEAESFGNVFGLNGCKVTLREGAACVASWYFILAEDGPRLLLEASGSYAPRECDLDGDGEDEVVTVYGLPNGWFIYDTARIGGEGRRYELTPDACGQTPVTFDAAEGFRVADASGRVMARYVLTATGSLLLQGYEE